MCWGASANWRSLTARQVATRCEGSVYDMRMARVNVYLPDELAKRVKEARLNVSQLTQEALRSALASGEVDSWLQGVSRLAPTTATHEDVVVALAAAKDDFDRG